MRKLLVIAALGLLVGLLMVEGNQAQAGHVNCGDILTVDTTLDGPLIGSPCPGTGLTIGADNITLDCKFNGIIGTGTDFGIHLDGRTGVTVENCRVKNFNINIFLVNSSGNTLIRNFVKNNTSFGNGGILLSSSDFNGLVKNGSINNAGRGILLNSSSNNRLEQNRTRGNLFRGIDLTIDSNDNVLTGNVAFENDSAGYVVSLGSTGNILERNQAYENQSEGFAIFSGGNILTENDANTNGTFGYNDTTTGNTGDVFPTDNFYFTGAANTCTPAGSSSPVGIC